jgi:putative phosphonate catabolism associated alcohol dehydrogenase
MSTPSARAAIFQAPGQPFTLGSFPLPTPGEGATLVRITCATICGSDIHTHAGRRHAPAPSVLGHEMVGIVESTNNPLFQPGDRVTWSMVWSCGDCSMCQSGLHPKCHRLFKFGHAPITSQSQFTGGFAEYCLLPKGTNLFNVPANISDPVASTANCATATVAATFRHAGDVQNKPILILGAGMLGLTAAAMARHLGASEVNVVDTNPARAALATQFGATPNPISKATHIFDFTGSPEAMESSLNYLATGGMLILAGAVFPSRAIQLPAEYIVRQCLTIKGVHNYSPQDLQFALDFLTQTTYPFDTLIEGRFSLDQINEAFEYANTHKPPRVAIYP